MVAGLLILGLIGRMDCDDQIESARATAEIMASAPAWAVTE
jgi:hypothetical protein